MPAKEADQLASIVNTAAAPPPSSGPYSPCSPKSSAGSFGEIHRLLRSLSTPAREEASGGGEPSSRGSCVRRSSTGRRRPEKERRGCLPGRQIGSSPRLERARCSNYNMGLQVSITVEHQYPCILVTTKCHTNECECPFSVHLGSGELIWGTLEICFLYIGHDNSSLDILQWLPARVFLLLLFLVDIQEATWHLMSTACFLVTSEMKEGCNGICIRHLFFK
ncbi:uncharacterized protein [Aegilops tauschii subsp. strangulata]|uniref:uncharacterized protein isoform X2 n=1 Tax=Triticum aestivum TaxID=4565 RepID=UPI001ABC6A09|nr:uncharacterized protein LOC109757620 isoform X2 [Aegilops tauschii subsp. strangulata]XP_044441299.1 uncharacterized protein LOC123167526 isoform X2 [Triticum aestivum]